MGIQGCACIPPDGDDWNKLWPRECAHHKTQRRHAEWWRTRQTPKGATMDGDLEEWLTAEAARVAKAREEAAATDPRFLHGTGFARAPLSKYDGFVMALRALCRMHGVQLSTSGYDCLVVSHLREGDDPIYQDHIEDGTKER